MIITDLTIDDARVHSDFLHQLHQVTGRPLLKFPLYKLSNRKFYKLVNNRQAFVMPYILWENLPAVEEMLDEIRWCSDNFKGHFSVKYTIRNTFPSDKIVIAFENGEDQLAFLLRSDFVEGQH